MAIFNSFLYVYQRLGTRGMIPKIACSTIFQMPCLDIWTWVWEWGQWDVNMSRNMQLEGLTRSDSIEGDTRRRSSSPTLKPSDFLDSDWWNQSGSPFFVFPLVNPSDMGNLVPECPRILWRGQFPVSKAQKPRFDGKKRQCLPANSPLAQSIDMVMDP